MRIAHSAIATALFLSAVAFLAPAVCAADATAPAADLPVLRVVPEDALGVVLVNHLDKVDEQLGKLAQEGQFPIPTLLPLLKAQLGIQEGLDEQGAAALALMPADVADAAPKAVAFIPVSDYKKFVAQFNPDDASAEIAIVLIAGEPHAVAHKGDFAVVVSKANKDALKHVLSGTRSVAPVIGGLAGWIGEHAISFVATPSGVKRGIAAAQKGLAQVKATLANSPDQTTKMAAGNLDIYDWFLQSADKEISQFAMGWHVDNDGGLHIDTRTLFVANGAWATAGKGLARPEGTKLAALPGGSFMMAFDGVMPKTFSKSFMNMSFEMIGNMSKAGGGKGLNEADAKKLNELMEKSLGEVQSMSMVMGPPKPGGSLYGNMAAVMKVKNAQQYVANYQQSIEGMAALMKQAGVDFPLQQETKKIKIDDLDGLELSMDMAAMFKKMPNPPPAQMLQMMFGTDGKLKIYLAPIDETTVAMSYVNSDNISRVKAACQHPQTSLAAEPDIEQTAKLLPPGAQWVGYVSPKGFIDFGLAMWLLVAPPGQPMPAIPAFPQTAPIGIGAEVSGKGLDLNIVVPGAAIKGVGTYFKQLQQMGRPGAETPQIR